MGSIMIHVFIFCNGFGILAFDIGQKPGDRSVASTQTAPKIPGTTPFDGEQAKKGYALNKMCFSFNSAENRAEFQKDEEAYMRKYGLNEQQAAAIRARNVLQLIAAGGNAYYLAKFAGIFHLDMQDIGAQQTGMSKEAFRAKLVAAGK
jgi:protocatechuate 4,5-dioxygenase alpha chain